MGLDSHQIYTTISCLVTLLRYVEMIAPIFVETLLGVFGFFPAFNIKTNFHIVVHCRQFDGITCSNSGSFPLSDVTKLSLSTACDPMGCSFIIIRGTCCK